jgi:hypothetical protein
MVCAVDGLAARGQLFAGNAGDAPIKLWRAPQRLNGLLKVSESRSLVGLKGLRKNRAAAARLRIIFHFTRR